MSIRKQTIYYTVLFILAAVTGITVGCLGQPYNTAVFTLHKIISIAGIVTAIVFIRRQIKQAGLTPAIRNSIIVMSVSALTLAVTGALMSVGVYHSIIRIAHAAAPALTAAAIVSADVLLTRNAAAARSGDAA